MTQPKFNVDTRPLLRPSSLSLATLKTPNSESISPPTSPRHLRKGVPRQSQTSFNPSNNRWFFYNNREGILPRPGFLHSSNTSINQALSQSFRLICPEFAAGDSILNELDSRAHQPADIDNWVPSRSSTTATHIGKIYKEQTGLLKFRVFDGLIGLKKIISSGITVMSTIFREAVQWSGDIILNPTASTVSRKQLSVAPSLTPKKPQPAKRSSTTLAVRESRIHNTTVVLKVLISCMVLVLVWVVSAKLLSGIGSIIALPFRYFRDCSGSIFWFWRKAPKKPGCICEHFMRHPAY